MITKLYRPVGLKELIKITYLNLSGFPPRLPEQPIFYPVLNAQYATQIAKEWNTKDKNSDYCGFVTMFNVDSTYLQKFKTEQVGGRSHKELWIPSEELPEFNSMIIGRIEIIDAYYGELYKGLKYDFKNKTVLEQMDYLKSLF